MANARHEAFALAVASGVAASTAYGSAGYSVGAAETSGPRLARNAQVAARIAFLRHERESAARAAATVDAGRVQAELEAVAFSDIGDVFDISDGGALRVRPLPRWSPATQRAIASVKVRRVLEGRGEDARPVEVIEFRLWPKIEAIRTLREHMGLDRSVTLAEIAKRLERQAEVLATMLPPEVSAAVMDRLEREVWR